MKAATQLARWLIPLAVLPALLPRTAVPQPPGGGRCDDPAIAAVLERSRRLPNPPTVLFDGRSELAKPPARQIAIPAPALPAAPACVALSVTFVDRGGALYVGETGYLTAAGTGMAIRGRGQALYDASTQILREMVQQELLPTRPRPGVRYVVMIPIAPGHALYRAASAAALARSDTAPRDRPDSPSAQLGRGYRDALLIEATDGVQVFLLGERANRYWFAVVRQLSPDEPVLDFAATADPGPMAQLGPISTARFQRLIAPRVRETGASQVTVEVRHYAVGTSVAHQPDSRYIHNTVAIHPLTAAAVEVPVGVERWTGTRRGSTGPYTWTTTAGFGTPFAEHNTVAAITAVQDSSSARVLTRNSARAARDASELVAVRAARERMAARERAKPARYAAAGLTYRAPATWNLYKTGRALRMIYEGSYPEAREDWVFGRTYFRAVTAYGDRCRHLLPPGSAMRIDSWFRNEYLTGRSLDQVDTIFIHRDFAHVFRAWHERKPGVPVTTPGEATAQGMMSNPAAGAAAAFEVAAAKDALKEDFDTFFEEDCRSGTVVQFMENLRRLGNGEPSLQVERVPETLPRPDDAPTTIGEACTRYDRDNGHPSSRTRCACLDRVLTPRYSAGDLNRLLENYSAFIERVSYAPDDSRTAPPLEYAAASACRQ